MTLDERTGTVIEREAQPPPAAPNPPPRRSVVELEPPNRTGWYLVLAVVVVAIAAYLVVVAHLGYEPATGVRPVGRAGGGAGPLLFSGWALLVPSDGGSPSRTCMDESPEVVDPSASETVPPPSRRRWLTIAIILLVVVAGLATAVLYGGVLRPASAPNPNGSVPPPGGSLAGWVTLLSENFTGRNVIVGTVGIVGPDRVVAGSEANLSVEVTPVCESDGCVAKVDNIQLTNGFILRGSSPSFPATFDHAVARTITITVGVPSLAGSYAVLGTVIGSTPPGPVSLPAMNWTVTYQGNASGYLQVRAAPPPAQVVPNATFAVHLALQSNDSIPVEVESLGVLGPFAVKSSYPGLPFELGPNGSVNLTVELGAPGPGTYSIHGSVSSGPAPVVVVAFVGYELIYDTNPFFTVGPNFSAPPAYLAPGAQMILRMFIFNADTVTHNYQVNGVLSPWLLASVAPTGAFAVGADSTGVWTLTITAPTTPGSYDLTVVVENTS